MADAPQRSRGRRAAASLAYAGNRKYSRNHAWTNLKPRYLVATVPLGTGYIRSDFLQFVEQPGTYAFPVAPPAPTALGTHIGDGSEAEH